ncbi:MAG TPA: hypothetical protein VNL38_00065 [Candidatus Nitrosotenuis sp.]|nr:hypothetical protein [Candidatus Nitrosotenuis sp.]
MFSFASPRKIQRVLCAGLLLWLLSLCAAPALAQAPVVLPAARQGDAYAHPLKIKNGVGELKWEWSGDVPPGIALISGKDGAAELKGTPTLPRKTAYEFTIKVTDSWDPPQTIERKYRLLVQRAEMSFDDGPPAAPPKMEFDDTKAEKKEEAKPAAEKNGAITNPPAPPAAPSSGQGETKPKNPPAKTGGGQGQKPAEATPPKEPAEEETGDQAPKMEPPKSGPCRGAAAPELRRPLDVDTNPLRGCAQTNQMVAIEILRDSTATETRRQDGKSITVSDEKLNRLFFYKTVADSVTGEFEVYLERALQEGQRVVLRPAELTKDNEIRSSGTIADQAVATSSVTDWGRARATFTSGIILSQQSNQADDDQFSKAHAYLGFNLDYNWYTRPLFKEDVEKGKAKERRQFLVNTYFDARLTSIAVCAQETTSGTGGTVTQPCNPASPAGTQEFLRSRKAALIQGGIFFPIVFKSATWTHDGSRNALFIAPIGKAGLQTITSREEAQAAGTSAEDTTFHFLAAGVRLGHYKFYASANRAPELISYLDILGGTWENFEIPDDKRLAIEGRIKIPSIPLFFGVDVVFGKGRDDVRFLFGTGFDVGNLVGLLRTGERAKEQANK